MSNFKNPYNFTCVICCCFVLVLHWYRGIWHWALTGSSMKKGQSLWRKLQRKQVNCCTFVSCNMLIKSSKWPTKHCVAVFFFSFTTYQNWRCHPSLQQSASSRAVGSGSTWASIMQKGDCRTSLILSQWSLASLQGFLFLDIQPLSRVLWRQ